MGETWGVALQQIRAGGTPGLGSLWPCWKDCGCAGPVLEQLSSLQPDEVWFLLTSDWVLLLQIHLHAPFLARFPYTVDCVEHSAGREAFFYVSYSASRPRDNVVILCSILELQRPGSLSELFSQFPLAFPPLSACFSLCWEAPRCSLAERSCGKAVPVCSGWWSFAWNLLLAFSAEFSHTSIPLEMGTPLQCFCWQNNKPQNPHSHCDFTPEAGPAPASDCFHKALFPSVCLNSSVPSYLWSRKWRQSRQSHLLLGNSPNTAAPSAALWWLFRENTFFFSK